MLGGMWGAYLGETIHPNRWEIANSAAKLFQHNSTKLVKGLDQDLLETFIWPIARQSVVINEKSISIYNILIGFSVLFLADGS